MHSTPYNTFTSQEMSHDSTVFNLIELNMFPKFLNSLKYSVRKVLLTNTLIFFYLYILSLSVNGHSLSEINFTSKMTNSSQN